MTKRAVRRWLTGFGLATLVGCTENAAVTSPALSPAAAHPMIAPDGTEMLSYNSISEVPPAYAIAEVRSWDTQFGLDGTLASGYGLMHWYGTEGRIDFGMSVLEGTSKVIEVHQSQASPSHAWPDAYMTGGPFRYTLGKSCGQTANLTAGYSARTRVLIQMSITELGHDFKSETKAAAQPACSPCSTDSNQVYTSGECQPPTDPYVPPSDEGSGRSGPDPMAVDGTGTSGGTDIYGTGGSDVGGGSGGGCVSIWVPSGGGWEYADGTC